MREYISLHGEWNFQVDSLDIGISEKWYNEPLTETVFLPGSMKENGKGKEVNLDTEWTGNIVDSSYFNDARYEKYRNADPIKIPFWLKPVKHYKGPAWYQKEVMVPGHWKGKQIFLQLERCHWESRVFVNEMEAGMENSLAAAHQYDITRLLRRGLNRITIRIDNRMIIPVGVNAHSVTDHTQGNWNGIVGKIGLEARNPISIKDVKIHPEVLSGTARVVVTLSNYSGESFKGMLEAVAESVHSEENHRVPPISREVTVQDTEQVIELEYALGGEVQLWSEFSPALYRLDLRLKNHQGKLLDRLLEDFGMREFRAKGTRFEVNGHPVFLRGTLECCIFPMTGYPPTDQASWEYVLKRCKEHGLNHIRFHSWCPPEAAFEAADRLGIYFQVECSSWTTVGDGNPVDSFIYAEGDRIMEAYGNHPSFCMMAYGNEPGGRYREQYLAELLEYWKSKDGRRVYTAGAGWPVLPENEYHNAPQPRIQHWREGLRSIINASPPQTQNDYRDIISRYQVPFVSHEIGQWCVYPDFQEIEKYTGLMKPTNFEIFRETLEENHMGHQADEFLMASGKLQSLCYKSEIEAALRTPGFAGFQLLQLHDFPGQGTALVGILDPFFGSKRYITPEKFRQFCNRTVPLARMDKRIFRNNETFRAGIEIAHFGETPLKDQRIIFRVTDASGNELHHVDMERSEIPVDNAIALGEVEYGLEEISDAGKLVLEVILEDTPFSNAWDFWVYPERVDPDPGDVFITDRLDESALKALSRGEAVLLLTHGNIREDRGSQVKIGFSSIFWNTAWTRNQAPHTLGILCNPEHPVFHDFPTEYHSNWQWWDPVSHSQVMIMDHFPPELTPLIQPIDTWFENRRLGLLFEAKLNNGKVMVCSIDLHRDISDRPVSGQLLHSILRYMNSEEFDPGIEIEPEQVHELLK